MALEIFFFCGIPLVSLMHAKSALHNLTNQTFIKPQKPSMHKRMVVGQRDSLVGSFAPEFLSLSLSRFGLRHSKWSLLRAESDLCRRKPDATGSTPQKFMCIRTPAGSFQKKRGTACKWIMPRVYAS